MAADSLAIASLSMSAISFVLLLVTLAFFLFPDFAKTLHTSGSGGGFMNVFVLAGAFAPDITLLSGFVSDVLNGSFRYSVTSFIGIFAVIVHYVIAGIFQGFSRSTASATAPASVSAVAPAVIPDSMSAIVPAIFGTGAEKIGGALPSFNACAIRGMGGFDIPSSPMGMVALSAVFIVYLLDMLVDHKRGPKDIGVYALFSAVVAGLNMYAQSKIGCGGASTFGQSVKSSALSVLVGLACGASGFAVLKTSFPSFLPLDTNVSLPTSSSSATCGAPNDKDQFVCETYKNGKLVG